MDLQEVDYKIATEIMGWKIDKLTDSEKLANSHSSVHLNGSIFVAPNGRRTFRLPNYSFDISDAMSVIDKINNLSFSICRENCMEVRYDLSTYNNLDMEDAVSVTCEESLPLAICKLALKYRGVL